MEESEPSSDLGAVVVVSFLARKYREAWDGEETVTSTQGDEQ